MCFFLTITVLSPKKFSIKEGRKAKTGFPVLQKHNRKKKSKYSAKTGKNTEGIKPGIRYVCDTSKSVIYYTTRDREDKSNTPMSHDTKRSSQNP